MHIAHMICKLALETFWYSNMHWWIWIMKSGVLWEWKFIGMMNKNQGYPWWAFYDSSCDQLCYTGYAEKNCRIEPGKHYTLPSWTGVVMEQAWRLRNENKLKISKVIRFFILCQPKMTWSKMKFFGISKIAQIDCIWIWTITFTPQTACLFDFGLCANHRSS